jgi:hypothetical protein
LRADVWPALEELTRFQNMIGNPREDNKQGLTGQLHVPISMVHAFKGVSRVIANHVYGQKYPNVYPFQSYRYNRKLSMKNSFLVHVFCVQVQALEEELTHPNRVLALKMLHEVLESEMERSACSMPR